MKEKISLKERLAGDEFLVSVQIDPPNRGPIAGFKSKMQRLAQIGVSLVDVNSSRRISHDSIQLACALNRFGFEVIPHVTTRDSSLNGIINQILAAYHWYHVKNYLLITGDPYDPSRAVIPFGGVFQVDSVGAIYLIDKYLRRGKDFIDVVLSAAVNQNEEDLKKEGDRIKQKEAVGTDFFMSQPVFNSKQAERLLDFYLKHSCKPLVVGIWPLISLKTVEVVKKGCVVGVKVPDEVVKGLSRYKNDPRSVAQAAVDLSKDTILFLKKTKKVKGVYLVAPFRDPLAVEDLFLFVNQL